LDVALAAELIINLVRIGSLVLKRSSWKSCLSVPMSFAPEDRRKTKLTDYTALRDGVDQLAIRFFLMRHERIGKKWIQLSRHQVKLLRRMMGWHTVRLAPILQKC
jgi:hypothetical protein